MSSTTHEEVASEAVEAVAEPSLATSRSRRDRGAKKKSRMTAMDELKASRLAGKKKWDDDEEIQNVYDVVDVDEYSELVSKRQNDDWIVDDDGGYVEDGREIFDEEMGDEADGHRSLKSDQKSVGSKKPGGKIQRKADVNATEESTSSTAGDCF